MLRAKPLRDERCLRCHSEVSAMARKVARSLRELLNLFRIHELLSGHVVQVIGRNLCISSQFIEETTCRYVIANTVTFY